MGVYLESPFSNNNLPIFMKLLLGMHNLCKIWESLLCRLLKCLYSLKQSKRLWNQNIIAFYKHISFKQLNGDSSILIYCSRHEISIFSVYINNFFLALNIINILNALKKFLVKKYDTNNLKEVKTIIGWQINRDTTAGTMKIYPSAFLRDLVIKKRLTNCNANIIPIKVGSSIKMRDLKVNKEADLCKYQRFIGKLIYFLYSTRPDIPFVVW